MLEIGQDSLHRSKILHLGCFYECVETADENNKEKSNRKINPKSQLFIYLHLSASVRNQIYRPICIVPDITSKHTDTLVQERKLPSINIKCSTKLFQIRLSEKIYLIYFGSSWYCHWLICFFYIRLFWVERINTFL